MAALDGAARINKTLSDNSSGWMYLDKHVIPIIDEHGVPTEDEHGVPRGENRRVPRGEHKVPRELKNA